MKKFSLIFSSLIAITLCISACNIETSIYVSPTGDDTNPGTEELPLASLEGARNLVQEIKLSSKGDIKVWLRGGTYYLNETVVFGPEDSGEGESSIIYQAYPNEKPVFSATAEISGWGKPERPIPDLPEEAQGKVWIADVPKLEAAPWHFYTLYDSEGRLPRARSKGFIPSTISNELSPENTTKNALHFPKGIIKNWPNLQDVEIVIRPHHAWIVNILPLVSVDEKSKIATTNFQATYSMDELYLLRGLESVWVENVPEALDEPGEWVLNSEEGKLYLWPKDGGSPQGIRAPLLREYIRIEGQVDKNGPVDTPVRNLTFRGITFTHGERECWKKGDKGLQHDWEMYDKATALVRFRGAENCLIENCHFTQSGGSAIRVDLYGQNIRIESNLIEHIGGTGILLAGHGPGEQDVNKNNLIYNNHIHHVGEIYWHSPGIFLWQSGDNRIANNLIHNTPYTGIIVSGLLDQFYPKLERNEGSNQMRGRSRFAPEEFKYSVNNLIEYNEIHHVMEYMGDGNGIYIRGAGNGNIIRSNYIHHLEQTIIMQCPIRTDGGQRGTLITENLMYKCVSHGIHLKLNNRAENNILIDIIESKHSGQIHPPVYFKLREGPLSGGAIKRNIMYHSGDNARFYDQGPTPRLPAAWAKEADTDYNIYYCVGNPELSRSTLEESQRDGIDMNSLSTDPLFVDPENGDFRLKPESPALKMGFKQIEISKIGLVTSHN